MRKRAVGILTKRGPTRNIIWSNEPTKTGKPPTENPLTAKEVPRAICPKEAWDELSPAEKKATNAKRQAGDKEGKQFVDNTAKAKAARKKAQA